MPLMLCHHSLDLSMSWFAVVVVVQRGTTTQTKSNRRSSLNNKQFFIVGESYAFFPGPRKKVGVPG